MPGSARRFRPAIVASGVARPWWQQMVRGRPSGSHRTNCGSAAPLAGDCPSGGMVGDPPSSATSWRASACCPVRRSPPWPSRPLCAASGRVGLPPGPTGTGRRRSSARAGRGAGAGARWGRGEGRGRGRGGGCRRGWACRAARRPVRGLRGGHPDRRRGGGPADAAPPRRGAPGLPRPRRRSALACCRGSGRHPGEADPHPPPRPRRRPRRRRWGPGPWPKLDVGDGRVCCLLRRGRFMLSLGSCSRPRHGFVEFTGHLPSTRPWRGRDAVRRGRHELTWPATPPCG